MGHPLQGDTVLNLSEPKKRLYNFEVKILIFTDVDGRTLNQKKLIFLCNIAGTGGNSQYWQTANIAVSCLFANLYEWGFLGCSQI